MINIKSCQMTKLVRICLVFLLIAGCSKQLGPNPRLEEDETFKPPQGRIVNAPLDFSFLELIPIVTHPGMALKDKTIEARVIKDIEDMIGRFESYTNPVNLPPYPALLEADMSKLTLVDHYYYSHWKFSFNNIYSLYFWGKYTFESDGKMEIVYIADALNFDLTTGNQLTVSDLLVNGADVQKTFNDLLIEQFSADDMTTSHFWPYLSNEWENEKPFSFQMTDTFSGIKGNQLFYIGLDGIYFIFDDRDPEFKTGNNPLVFHIPFYKIAEELAISERFKTEISIFENPAWEGRLLTLTNESDSSESEDTFLQKYKEIDIFLVSETIEIPDSYKEVLPETIDDELLMLIEKVKSMIDSYSEPSQITKATITKSVHAFGNYISVEWGLDLITSIQGLEYIYDRVYHVYNKQGEPVALGSLFVTGFPYEELLIDRMKNFENFEKYSQQELLDSLQFSLAGPRIKLHTSLLKSKDVPGAYFGGSWYYNDIGIENLALSQ
ncbi:MAG: hypothetical protein CVU85_06920 [Firmicutes bacterium HGW-Firmicutes-10]|nr:MAG: hypothetical protein CVU85_06920 [Firmicutes bacterium HGW-Firmicutes-10]